MKRLIVCFLGLILLSACATSFKVLTEPDKAEVFIVDQTTGEESPLGPTPVTKTGVELEEILKGQNSPGGLVNVLIKKDGFVDRDLYIPVNGSGQLDTQLNIKLRSKKSSKEELKTAQDILNKLFLTQQFARSQQLERALIEIDKILAVFPEFDRALSMKAAIYYGQGKFEESLKWYESAIAANPEMKTAIDMAAKVRQTLKLPTRLPPRVPASGNTAPQQGAKPAQPATGN